MSAPADAHFPAGAKLRLAGEIVTAYVVARFTLRRRGLPEALEALRTATTPAKRAIRGPQSANGRQLARAVIRTLAILPADSRCLMRSLVLTRLLARRGIDSRLVIAVRPGEHFAAHSWVEHEGEPLLPGGAPAFERLVTL